MSSLRIRPRFKEELPISSHTFCQRLEKAIAGHDDFTGLVSENYCVLKIAKAARHYWSPQLTLSLEQPEEEENKTQVRGLYGPRQSVWAIFFMSYAALGVLALFAGVMGLSSLMLGKSTLILWAIPVMAAIALVLYLVAQAGQKIGAEQMFRIHHFYEDLFKHRVAIE